MWATAEVLIARNRSLIAEARTTCALAQQLRTIGAARRAGHLDGWFRWFCGGVMTQMEVESQFGPIPVFGTLIGVEDRAHRAAIRALAAEERAKLHRQQAVDARDRAQILNHVSPFHTWPADV